MATTAATTAATESGAVTAVAEGAVPGAAPVRPPFLVHHKPAGPVQVMSWNCEALPSELPQGLGLTYWFDPAPAGQPYPVSVRFDARRIAGPEAPGMPDTFEVVRSLEGVLPGSGPVALTARVPDVAPGQWRVTAAPVAPQSPSGAASQAPRRWAAALPAGEALGTTAWLRVANERAPGVRIGAWPALVGLGAAVALTLQAVLAAQRGLPAGRLLLISLLASLLGVAGAKAYYLLTHRGQRRGPLTQGMSLQGSMIAVFGSLLLGSWLAGIPIGPMLDVTPGLLFGLAVGRWGCFFGGCCVGRPTASRWGIWSSDRWLGVRRIPVQLMESSWAGILAVATLIAVLTVRPAVGGLLFVAGFAAYTFGRQVLFPLRTVPRRTTHGRLATLVLSGVAVGVAVLVLVLN